MSSPFDRIMARRRGIEPVQETPETETSAAPEIELPLPLRMLLSKVGIDPIVIIGHLKNAQDIVLQKVDNIDSKLSVILESQARQMVMLDRYNDTLILCLQRLTEIESNQRLTPVDEFGDLVFDNVSDEQIQQMTSNIFAGVPGVTGVAGGIEVIDK